MNTEDKNALDILAQATEPQNSGRISREGYVKIHEALQHIAARLAAPTPEAPALEK